MGVSVAVKARAPFRWHSANARTLMLPPSARYLADFVDDITESRLLDAIDQFAWLGDLKRRVQHHGFRYDYKARRVTNDAYLGPLPVWLRTLAERLQKEGLFQAQPDQVIVNEYLPGQGIASHVDCEPCFGDTIASLSLPVRPVFNASPEPPQPAFAGRRGSLQLDPRHSGAQVGSSSRREDRSRTASVPNVPNCHREPLAVRRDTDPNRRRFPER